MNRKKSINDTLSRKYLHLFGLLILLSLLMAACGAQGAEENTPESETGQAAPAEEEGASDEGADLERSGGVLRVATSFEPVVTNPHWRGEVNAPWYLAVYDPLTRYDENNEIQPYLAESWEFNDELTELVLNIRQGVQFHSGRTLTAEDVKWNIERIQNPDVVSQMKRSMNRITAMEIVDEYTLILTFDEPFSNIFDSFESILIFDPEAATSTEAGEEFSGTGPFMISSFEPGSKLTLERNPNYWQEGLPNLDGIEFTIVPDKDAMVLNLESGAVDMIIAPNTQDVQRLQEDNRFSVILSSNEAPRYFVAFNLTNDPFDRKLVRQAFNYAIPRDRFASTTMFGLIEPTDLPWSTTSAAYDAEQAQEVTFDLNRARELLDEAGVNPEGMPITIVYNANVGDLEPFSVMYQDALSQLGFSVNLEPAEGATYGERHNSRDFSHILVGLHNIHMMSPISLLTEQRPWLTGDASTGGFESDEYVQLVNEAVATTDSGRLDEIYNQINQIILDEAFTLAFGNGAYAWITEVDVSQVDYNRFNWVYYDDIQLGN